MSSILCINDEIFTVQAALLNTDAVNGSNVEADGR